MQKVFKTLQEISRSVICLSAIQIIWGFTYLKMFMSVGINESRENGALKNLILDDALD